MHWVSPEEALEEIDMEIMVYYMDDDTREAVYYGAPPCTDAEFIAEYLRRAPDDLIIG